MGLFDKLLSKSKMAEKETGNLSSQDVIDAMHTGERYKAKFPCGCLLVSSGEFGW